MMIATRKITWMSISFAFALLVGVPAVADDTELLLLNPNQADRPKANVMFILDSSGSMTTEQDTSNPYDSTRDYGGDCNINRLYWTDVDVEPVCDLSNTQYFEKSVYNCDFSMNQIDGIGSYTDTMIMFRENAADPGKYAWQDFAPGVHDRPVECLTDSGVHGSNTGPGDAYARTGSSLSDGNEFTNNADQEVSWGSPPRNIDYTVYDGNYLNWKANPETVSLSRSVIMKEVTKKVLSSVNNLNVGLMRFDGNDGGAVILDITDLDANRQTVLDAVDQIPATGNTPLSETLYEAALFWRGMPAKYGDDALTNLTDQNALAILDPETYEQPDWDVCAKNYNVLLSDGEPREDFDTPDIIGNLPNIAGALGYAGCDGEVLTVGGGQCLDDIAEYLSVEDIDPNDPAEQFVTTHTIGFTIDLPLLKETAEDSQGQYFLANDVESLTRTLLSIIANINSRALSFSAPAVSVNTFNRTQNLNDLYITTFGARSNAHWPGNLKKYRILNGVIVDDNDAPAVDPATGFFDEDATSIWSTVQDGNDVLKGGAVEHLPDPANRNLYTNLSGTDLTVATNHVSTDNAANFSLADFGLSGAAGEPTKNDIIDWARGVDVRDEDSNPSTTVRKAMGDPLHSQPAAIVYGGTAANPDVVIYTATNDGYLHAVDGDTGEELWSFIPKDLLANLTRLYFDPRSKFKQYGIDGNIVPVIKDVDDDGIIEPADDDFVIILFGMRRGGNSYYALDVTDRSSPQLLWKRTLPLAGESWSTPVIARVDIDTVAQNTDNAVVVIGGGYDTAHDTTTHPAIPDGVGAGLHFIDLISGAQLWRAGSDAGANLRLDTPGREMDRAIPNEVRVIDLSGDGLADRMYATDLGGQILRFDIYNGAAPGALVTGGVIAQLGAEGLGAPTAADTRRFYNAPDVSLVTDERQQRRYIAISVGSGYRAHPFDLSAADRFFSVRDGDVFKQLPQAAYDGYSIVTDADLVEVSGKTLTVITSNDRGWKFTLPANQKIVSDSLTFDDQIFFVAFSPDSVAAESCSAGEGSNFLYRVSAINGDPVVPNLSTLDPALSDDERRTTLQQGGIAPTPTVLFPSPEPDCEGDECKPPPIFCVGVECEDPGFENNPVRTLWTQDGIE
ncbi:MAG: PilC/PilY family type IV pilus protein [Gammaproteobacteria bacterium]|nr:PilC/PilY family type IV pilus protein [Gammaproteobacteria bacterium]